MKISVFQKMRFHNMWLLLLCAITVSISQDVQVINFYDGNGCSEFPSSIQAHNNVSDCAPVSCRLNTCLKKTFYFNNRKIKQFSTYM